MQLRKASPRRAWRGVGYRPPAVVWRAGVALAVGRCRPTRTARQKKTSAVAAWPPAGPSSRTRPAVFVRGLCHRYPPPRCGPASWPPSLPGRSASLASPWGYALTPRHPRLGLGSAPCRPRPPPAGFLPASFSFSGLLIFWRLVHAVSVWRSVACGRVSPPLRSAVCCRYLFVP